MLMIGGSLYHHRTRGGTALTQQWRRQCPESTQQKKERAHSIEQRVGDRSESVSQKKQDYEEHSLFATCRGEEKVVVVLVRRVVA